MWIHKVRKRKMQFAIITLILFVATAILTGCLAFALETSQVVKNYFKEDQCPLYYMVIDYVQGNEDAVENPLDILTKAPELKEKLREIETMPAYKVDEDLYINTKKMKNTKNYFYVVRDRNELKYTMDIAKGEDKKAPADDEIWISNVYAKAYDLQIGDRMKIGNSEKEYRISAFVYTPLSSSGFIDDYPFFVSEEMGKGLDAREATAVNIYTKKGVSLKEFKDAIPEEFDRYILYMMDRDDLQMCLTILSSIFGGVGAAAGLIILVVSMIVIRYLIRATIAKEYRMIGIYKSLGKENAEIRKIYFTAYMLSGVIGIVGGIFAGRPLVGYLGKTAVDIAEEFPLSYITNIISGVSLLIMAGALAINILSELRKLKEISPLQALNFNHLSSKEKVTGALIKNASSSVAMAVNNVVKNRAVSLLTIGVLAVTVYMNLLSVSIGHTLMKYDMDRHIWENLPSYSGYVDLKSEDPEKVRKYLEESEEVEDYVYIHLNPGYQTLEFEDFDLTSDAANPMLYEDFTEKRYEGVPYTEGRICTNRGEITCSEDFLGKVDKEVGDYLTLKNGDRKEEMLIVGKYSAMMRGGTSFYIRAEDAEKLGFEVVYEKVMIFLKENADFSEFEKKIIKKFPALRCYDDFEFISQEGKTVADIANPICVVLIAAFSAFSVLNIVNLVYTQLRENRRKHGILKAMGFSSGYIRRECLAELILEFVVAAVAAVVLHILISPLMFKLACGVYFIRSPWWISVLVCGLMFVGLVGITRILLYSVKKISPVELMEE